MPSDPFRVRPCSVDPDHLLVTLCDTEYGMPRASWRRLRDALSRELGPDPVPEGYEEVEAVCVIDEYARWSIAGDSARPEHHARRAAERDLDEAGPGGIRATHTIRALVPVPRAPEGVEVVGEVVDAR